MNLNNPIKSPVSFPNKKGMLITYFNTNEGLEFIEAVRLHLEDYRQYSYCYKQNK
jgi:hypothetical protein